MGRQLQLATTQQDEVALLRLIRDLAPIRVLGSFAWSADELWIDDWESRVIPTNGFYIWPTAYDWSPEYLQTGGPNCPQESVGMFYVDNLDTAPVFQFRRSFLEQRHYGRIYWGRDFSAPDGLDYDDKAFDRLTDSIWRVIRRVGRRLPGDKYSPYFLPDAWSRYGNAIRTSE